MSSRPPDAPPPHKLPPQKRARLSHCGRCGITGHTRPRCTARLIESAKQNRLHVVKKMLAFGEDVNQIDPQGYTALMWACQMGHVNMVSLLLRRRNIQINLRTAQVGTALLLAVTKNQVDVVRILLASRRRVDVNLPTANSSFTALMIASRMNFAPIARILLAHRDIDIHLKNKDGNTALKIATLYNANTIVQMIEAFLARELEVCLSNRYCRHLHEQYGKNDCPICLEQMLVGGDSICIAGDCGHRMHSSCLQKWNQGTCPICRKPTRSIAGLKGVKIYSKFQPDSNRVVAPSFRK